jgi:transcriptional regulator with XRE-family HTH domain
MITFANQLEQWRKIRDLRQKEAADKLDVPFGTYRSWERGKKTPHKLTMPEIQRRMEAIPPVPSVVKKWMSA